MAALRRLAFVAAALLATPARANEVGRWRAEIDEASALFGVPPAWIERVMTAESGGRTRLDGRLIVSRAGAMGLMQLMPATWAAMRARLGLGRDPHQPRDNILAGTFYLRLMYEKFGYPGLFGAYNAGPGRYAQYVSLGRPLPAETRAYLATTAGTVPASHAASGLAALPHGRPLAATSGIFFALSVDASHEASVRGLTAGR